LDNTCSVCIIYDMTRIKCKSDQLLQIVFLTVLSVLAVWLFCLSPGKVYAQSCISPDTSKCTYVEPGCTAASIQCIGGRCYYTWSCECACGWGEWGACVDGAQNRYCLTPCAQGLYQQQTCCVSTTWGACSVSCGGGTQTDNCGTTRACNTQACCTAPTGLSYTRDGTTGVVDALSWTRGTGGTNQYLYVDDTRADVEAGLPVCC
jgi:hypothetical protein